MAKKKETATQREWRLIRNQLRSLEKRGFIVEPFRKKLKGAKYQTLASYRKKGYAKLYREMKAVDPSTGELISGIEKRKQERILAQQKAKETRERKKQKPRILSKQKRDDKIYNDLKQMISSYDTTASDMLNKALNEEIEKYGYDAVIGYLGALNDDNLSDIDRVLKYDYLNDNTLPEITKMLNLITGTIPSAETMRKIGRVAENSEEMQMI